jgi:hypothetical protein
LNLGGEAFLRPGLQGDDVQQCFGLQFTQKDVAQRKKPLYNKSSQIFLCSHLLRQSLLFQSIQPFISTQAEYILSVDTQGIPDPMQSVPQFFRIVGARKIRQRYRFRHTLSAESCSSRRHPYRLLEGRHIAGIGQHSKILA